MEDPCGPAAHYGTLAIAEPFSVAKVSTIFLDVRRGVSFCTGKMVMLKYPLGHVHRGVFLESFAIDCG